MSEEKLIPLQHYLDDARIVAVADAWVKTQAVIAVPPTWNTLAEQMDEMRRKYGEREAQSCGWRAVGEAIRFVKMMKAYEQFAGVIVIGGSPHV